MKIALYIAAILVLGTAWTSTQGDPAGEHPGSAGSAAPAFNLKELPAAPQGRVSDYAGVLDPAARAALEEQLVRYEHEDEQGSAGGEHRHRTGTGPQIVVVTLPSLGGDPIEDVSIRLGERWKIGSRADDGVILLLAPTERKVRIEVGYGAEGRLPDAVASRIIQEIISPRLRGGDLAGGLQAGAAAIHQALSGQPITGEDPKSGIGKRPVAQRPGERPGGWGLGIGGLFFVLLLLLLLLGGGRRGGGGGSFLAGMLLGSLFGGGGGRRGDGGGGGFSGGGGSFGGGGASGNY